MKMLFVDDERVPPRGFIVARNYGEAIEVLSSQKIDILSLDHDLGLGKSGYDIAKWIVENRAYPDIIFLHSFNPVGSQNMFKILSNRWKPEHVRVKKINYFELRKFYDKK